MSTPCGCQNGHRYDGHLVPLVQPGHSENGNPDGQMRSQQRLVKVDDETYDLLTVGGARKARFTLNRETAKGAAEWRQC